MELPQLLPPLTSCTLCPLHTEARSVGIPSLHLTGSPSPQRGTPAFFILAQNPGYHEDIAALPFVGLSGAFLRLIICRLLPLTHHHLGDPHDPLYLARPRPQRPPPRSAWALPFSEPEGEPLFTTYVGNAARCFTAADTVPLRAYSKCAPHLRSDLLSLLSFHSSLYVLCLGAPAASSFLKLTGLKKATLSTAFSMNGRLFHLAPSSTPIHFFATYHPAHILRNNNMIRPLSDHLALILRHLHSLLPPITTPTFIPLRRPSRRPQWQANSAQTSSPASNPARPKTPSSPSPPPPSSPS
jgi:uracil-DNA glycosylase family 4